MIVIHVGLRKSGSATIQTFFDENAKRLRELSIYYPKTGRKTRRAHHNFAHEIRGLKRFDSNLGTLAECARDWGECDDRVMVLSSEMFEEVDTPEAMKMKQKLLETRQSEFRIYLVVRDLVDLVPSSYAQKVKAGYHTYDFDTFFAHRMRERRVHVSRTVRRWAKAFGWESMYVRSLDRSDLLNGDLVEDFLAVCGVTESTDKHRLVRTGLQNASPGWRVLEAMRALSGGYHGLASNHPLQSVRRHGIFLGECAFEVGEARGWNTDRGRYLTRDQAQRCYDIYRRSVLVINEKLQRKLPLPLGLDERGFSAREFVPHLKHIPRQELNAFYDDLWDAFRSSESTP